MVVDSFCAITIQLIWLLDCQRMICLHAISHRELGVRKRVSISIWALCALLKESYIVLAF